jgi:hypothetical protein
MKNLFFEDFINIEKSNSRLKYQEDCHVPAIGILRQMQIFFKEIFKLKCL